MERTIVVKTDKGVVLGRIYTNRMLDVHEVADLLDLEPTDYDKQFVEQGYRAQYYYGPDGKAFDIEEIIFDDEE
ncbi:hypothetical protein [Megasphaera massiliensis]|uniref:hypothetical protein n=1 Tax=Megasphaera massiliensis TaxID=1232428 RepID=UPI0004106A9E|nr:hypothetical protein [Megasphaera massiliensis]DAF84526.1 MAG TPA: hypothetical protein [Caudoviricetes sp.]